MIVCISNVLKWGIVPKGFTYIDSFVKELGGVIDER